MNPLDHIATMHTNDDRDRLWITCSCGWSSGERIVTTEAGWHAIHRGLVEQARAHYDAQEGAS